jgi:type IX secretion system PorP/SprF family membrane protein
MQRVKCIVLVLLLSNLLHAQDISNFTQFFFNPYTINPSFAGTEGKGAVFLAYRKQWSGIEGGPTVANLTYHAPVKSGLSWGMNVANDQRGLLSNSGLLFTAAYSLSLDDSKYIRFGLSAGGSWNTVDLQKIQNLGTDPALANLINQNASIIGNFGISAHLKSFHIGLAMPNLFSPSYVSEDAFTVTEVKPFQALILHASNRFYFSQDKFVFEPYVVYRINNGLPSQYELAGVLHINHLFWVGGSYKQEFGFSGFGGMRINKSFAVGGSYTLKNTGDNELNYPSFEIQLSYLLGPSKSKIKPKGKQPDLPLYSFTDTEKKKAKKPVVTPTQLAAEKKRQEDLARKKEEEARLAKAEEEKKAQLKAEEERRKAAEVAALHAEEDRLATKQLEEHQTTMHEDSLAHPVNERHETVKQGSHANELKVDNYVIAGVFGSGANAKKYAESLVKLGFGAGYGHLTEKNQWYVYVFNNSDINNTRAARDEFRKFKIMQNAWLLTVTH